MSRAQPMPTYRYSSSSKAALRISEIDAKFPCQSASRVFAPPENFGATHGSAHISRAVAASRSLINAESQP